MASFRSRRDGSHYPLPTLSFHFTLWLALGGYVLAGIFGVLFLSKRLKVVRA